jgi:uncharacterized Zn-binding protein involved in type VI secretion
MSVAVNPPKTPVTEGSSDTAPATMPNVCKMPGPPAPFVPTPLPNIGRSRDNLADCTSTVLIEGKKIAIKGSYYMSAASADAASKGTGGGIVSSSAEGKTQFVAPGSMNVKAEGKNIQLLGDGMTNNGSNPPNSANLANIQNPGKHVQACANALCNELCDALKNGESSNDLEKRLANDPRMKRLGLKFRTRAIQMVHSATAQAFSRSAIAAMGVTAAGFVRVEIKPDVVLGATVVAGAAGGFSLIKGMVKLCFDFKLPGDTVGRGTKYADQLDRQARLARGRRPVVIACPPKGVCDQCAYC